MIVQSCLIICKGYLFSDNISLSLPKNRNKMKFLETLKKYQQQILLVLFVLLFLRSCGTGSELTKLRKELEAQRTLLNELPTRTDVQIEGLKAEKRMIQATDRKLLDVRRQTEIENLINELQNSK
jgi:hypothetical protein